MKIFRKTRPLEPLPGRRACDRFGHLRAQHTGEVPDGVESQEAPVCAGVAAGPSAGTGAVLLQAVACVDRVTGLPRRCSQSLNSDGGACLKSVRPVSADLFRMTPGHSPVPVVHIPSQPQVSAAWSAPHSRPIPAPSASVRAVRELFAWHLLAWHLLAWHLLAADYLPGTYC